MKTITVTPRLSVAGQIDVADVADIAAAGFRILVNNRPDGEAAGQPASSAIAAAARESGLEYIEYPVGPTDFPGPDPVHYGEMLDNASGPVLAFCRSGTRSISLWVATRPREELPEALERARSLGFDLSGLGRSLMARDL
ncbi:TIGR01244 family phosphatase [Kineobactrum sediminis]|uniref:TIGR01244 family phosphatase n=1 Tax=Kineobactrum sediminis TaxID=1905677 RepID=A0A2N5Y454_9GAMM|nr:TIGR01244 family sulfur transferase [Kineobactrum sediminis]PLW83176.1 TIGR01244 family phosphatase [Kineobactrum sediminis]